MNNYNTLSLPLCFFLFLRNSPQWARASSFTRYLVHTQRRTTFGGTLLDEWSALRRDLYVKTQNNGKRQTSMPPVRFEPTNSAGERPQTYALDRAATGTGPSPSQVPKINCAATSRKVASRTSLLLQFDKLHHWTNRMILLILGSRKLNILALDNQDIFLSFKTSTP